MASKITRTTVASTIGTALEWYDFALYGTAAALVLPAVFFPESDPVLATLSALATFAVGFGARPVGGVIIGILGDRVGRRAMLFATLMLMCLSSTAIGLLPSYASIGVLAPTLLVVFRILQGLGAGGEYAGAMLLSAEHAGQRSRGLNAASPTLGNAMGSLVAAGVYYGASASMSEAAFIAWGWRIPFLLSLLVGVAGVIIRLKVTDSPEFVHARQMGATRSNPLAALLTTSKPQLGVGALVSLAPNVLSYLPSVYALTYLADPLGLPSSVGLIGILIANALKAVTVPTAGWLCDRIGRRPVMIMGSVAGAIMVYPFFLMLDTQTPVIIWAAFVILFTLCNDLTLASQATMMSELFDVAHRYTGVTFSREITGALVGGTIPFVAAWLLGVGGGHTYLIALYAGILCLGSAGGALLFREPEHLQRRKPLEAALTAR